MRIVLDTGPTGNPTPGPTLGSAPPTATTPVERLGLHIDEVAAALGVCKRTVQRRISDGTFPKGRKAGKFTWWTAAAVTDWINSGGKR